MLKVRSKFINWGESCWGWLNRIALAICDHYFFACSNNITCINVNMPTIKILTVVIRLIALHWPSVTMLNDSYLVNFFNYTQCITVNPLCLMNVMFIKNKFCHHLLFSCSKPVHLSCSTCKRLSRIAWQKHILTRDCQVPKKNKTKKKPYHNSSSCDYIPSLLKSHYSFGWRKAKFMVLFHRYLCCYPFKSCSSQISFAQRKVLVNNINLSIFPFKNRIIKYFLF